MLMPERRPKRPRGAKWPGRLKNAPSHPLAGAVEKLPRFLRDPADRTEAETLRATGTDGANSTPPLAPSLRPLDASRRIRPHHSAQGRKAEGRGEYS
jgi:hypothetical protein